MPAPIDGCGHRACDRPVRYALLAIRRAARRPKTDAGAIVEPAAYFSKHPPVQIEDREARQLVENFITSYGHTA